jgi:membrane protease YdiL (CAAX protease family)
MTPERSFIVPKKAKYFLLGLFLLGTASYQIVYLAAAINADFYTVNAAIIDAFSYALRAFSYLLIVILICSEINNLEEFNVDKFTLISLILFSFMRLIFERNPFSILIGLACILLIVTFFARKPTTLRTNLRWAILSIVISVAVMVSILLVEKLLRDTWPAIYLYKNNLTITTIGLIIKELSLTSLPEEILFRGLIWGYLKKEGWGENRIIWTQGILFWFLHFGKLFTPFAFFVVIPVLTVIASQFTKRSRQIFPAVLSHTIMNTIGVIFRMATF